MAEDNKIGTEALQGDFEQFLKINGNKRIFLTGKYGIGKTCFLEDFFSSHNNEYEAFHLFPVNYQVSTIEDIVDLLKYDVLIELIKKDGKIFAEKPVNGIKESGLLFLSWLKERGSINGVLQSVISNGEEIIEATSGNLLAPFTKLGKPLKDLLKIDAEYQEFKKNYIAGEKGQVDQFIKALKAKNISETDYHSHLIKNGINKLKGSKKSVLILDDMDRIDPEHIFRILNVFSAHFNGEENKFGFDHIVIVGDVQNIKHIFHHKFGPGADFEGYFDKFFTVKPYLLDNKKIISEKISDIVKRIKCEEENLNGAMGEGGYIKLYLVDILVRATEVDKLNLRQLYKPVYYNFPELKKGAYANDPFSDRDSFKRITDIGIRLAISILGSDKNHFVSVLRRIKENIRDNDDGNGAPYSAYAKPMIGEVFGYKNAGVVTPWKDHTFTMPDSLKHSREVVNVVGDKAATTKFFYDLLIEYVEKSKYNNSRDRDYD